MLSKVRIICGLMLICANALAAEEILPLKAEPVKNKIPQMWGNLSVGLGDLGPAGEISVNYRVSEYQLAEVRFINNDELFGESKIKDIGLLYGLIAKWKYAYVAGLAGLSYVEYDKYHGGFFTPAKYEYTKRAVGIPLEVQAFLTPTPYVGIGIVGFANINSARSYKGAALSLQLGNLW